MNAPESRRAIEDNEPRPATGGRAATQAAYFVNDRPIRIDERDPTVRAIVKAAGYAPDKCAVYRLDGPRDTKGTKVGLDERLHATVASPVYLRCEQSGRKPQTGVAPGTESTPVTAGGASLTVQDIESFANAPRPRDQASSPPPPPPGRGP